MATENATDTSMLAASESDDWHVHASRLRMAPGMEAALIESTLKVRGSYVEERIRVRNVFQSMDQDNDNSLGLEDMRSVLRERHMPVDDRVLSDMAVFSSGHAPRRHYKADFETFLRFHMWKESQLQAMFNAVAYIGEHDAGSDSSAINGGHNLEEEEEELSETHENTFAGIEYDQANSMGVMAAEVLEQNSDEGEAVYIGAPHLYQYLHSVGLKHISVSDAESMLDMISDDTHAVNVDEWLDALLLLPGMDDRSLLITWHRTATSAVEVHGRWWKQLVAGAIGGAVSRTFTAPLDRLKTVLQSQSGESVGTIRCLKNLYREGGVWSLWRSNGVNVIKIAPETAIKFFAWEEAKKYLYSRDAHDVTTAQRFLAGSVAGVVAQVSIFPLEVLKTRLANAKTGQYKGVWHCMRQIMTREGVRVLYRGLIPGTLGVIPYAGIDLAIYDSLKAAYLTRHASDLEHNVFMFLGFGAVSSSCGQLVTYPLSRIRTRMQANGGSSSMITEMRDIYRTTGLRGFYFGLTANFLKVVPAVSTSYFIYEQTKTLLGFPNH